MKALPCSSRAEHREIGERLRRQQEDEPRFNLRPGRETTASKHGCRQAADGGAGETRRLGSCGRACAKKEPDGTKKSVWRSEADDH